MGIMALGVSTTQLPTELLGRKLPFGVCPWKLRGAQHGTLSQVPHRPHSHREGHHHHLKPVGAWQDSELKDEEALVAILPWLLQ